MADLSVVVLSYNTRAVLNRCLTELFGAAADIDLELQVIVVDNGSSDGTVEHLRQHFPEVELILNKRNVGFAVGNNQGMARATADFILLLNSDAFIDAMTIERALEVMRRRPATGVVGVRLVNEDGTFQAGPG